MITGKCVPVVGVAVYTPSAPVERTVAVPVTPGVVERASKPAERLLVYVVVTVAEIAFTVAMLRISAPSAPFALALTFWVIVPLSAAVAGEVARTPAPRATTATSAMRLRSVFVDMFFLSLVEIGHFPISARRSFDLLIPFLL
jgi:hypothetical protein